MKRNTSPGFWDRIVQGVRRYAASALVFLALWSSAALGADPPAAQQALMQEVNRGTDTPSATSILGLQLLDSTIETERSRGMALLEQASSAGDGPACVGLAFALWGQGDVAQAYRIDQLLDCGAADKLSREIASLFKGVFAGLAGDDETGKAMLARASTEGLKQAGAFAVALGYPVPPEADATVCDPFCDFVSVLTEARRVQRLALNEQQREVEIARLAQERAAAEAAYYAQLAATEEAEARKQRRRRFWMGALTVALALASGYVQAQANVQYLPRPTLPVSPPPAIYTPALPSPPPIYTTVPNPTQPTPAVYSSGAPSSTYQRIGSMTYGNDSDGTSSTSQRVGNITYRNDSDGASGTHQRIGNTTYRNDNDGYSSTSQRVGNATYTTDSSGNTSTTQKIGNTTYTNYVDGSSRICTMIGNTLRCD